MARYANDSRERVREAVDFVDLVSQKTELRRQGTGRYVGLCPFHDERSPSFGIEPQEKLFHCFGCGEGGDVFSFVQKSEGVDFVGALELLADRYGVELERAEEDPESAKRRAREERLLDLLERTATFYARYLWDSAEAAGARRYLADRGLDEEALRTYRVGFAPSRFDIVLKASLKAGFKAREAYDAGLVQRSKQGPVIDRFRRRIMFPLCDRRGRVLGFGARAVGPDQQPKYLNSSDNDVYHKGEHLFGSDIARAEATRAGSVVLCEGYTDVIAMHQAGMRNAVGLMGTALTPNQVTELARLAPVVKLALDADGAGQKAMLRAEQVAKGKRLELRVVPLPAGEDPADAVRERGPEAVRALVDASVPFVTFRVQRELEQGDVESAEGKDRLIDALRPVFHTLPSSALKEELQRTVAEAIGMSPSLVAGWLASPSPRVAEPRPSSGSAGPEAAQPQRAPAPVRAPMSAEDSAERRFLSACVAMGSTGREALSRLDVERTFVAALTRRAAVHVRSGIADDGSDPELTSLLAELALGRAEEQTAAGLAAQGHLLRLKRLEAQLREARTARSGNASDLAREREQVKREFEQAMDDG